MLVVKPSGRRSWVLRYQINGRRRDLGPYPEVTLARADENPARWVGHLENILPKPSRVHAVEYHAALD